MVFAAPLFLVAQTRAFANFYQVNREPLLRMTLGVFAAWMGLRAVSKSYEASKLADEVELHLAQLAAVRALVEDKTWVGNAATSAGYLPKPNAADGGWGRKSAGDAVDAAPAAGLLSTTLRTGIDGAIRAVQAASLAGKGTSATSAAGSAATGAATGQAGAEGAASGVADRFKGFMAGVKLPQTERLTAAREKARTALGDGAAGAEAAPLPPAAAVAVAAAIAAKPAEPLQAPAALSTAPSEAPKLKRTLV